MLAAWRAAELAPSAPTINRASIVDPSVRVTQGQGEWAKEGGRRVTVGRVDLGIDHDRGRGKMEKEEETKMKRRNSRKSVTWSAVPDAPLFVYVVM